MASENIARTIDKLSIPGIMRINLEYINLTESDITKLSTLIVENKNLIELTLDSCKLSPNKLRRLILALEKNLSITKLGLQNTTISTAGLKKICKLFDNWERLRELHLSGLGKKYSEDIKILCSFLKNNNFIESLHLNRCNIRDVSIEHLSDLFKTNMKIKDVVLDFGVSLPLEYIAELLNALTYNQSIESFELVDENNWEEYYRSNALLECTTGNFIQSIASLLRYIYLFAVRLIEQLVFLEPVNNSV